MKRNLIVTIVLFVFALSTVHLLAQNPESAPPCRVPDREWWRSRAPTSGHSSMRTPLLRFRASDRKRRRRDGVGPESRRFIFTRHLHHSKPFVCGPSVFMQPRFVQVDEKRAYPPIMMPPGVNLSGMWRVHGLDRISARKPAQLPDSRSLTLSVSRRRIWPVFLP